MKKSILVYIPLIALIAVVLLSQLFYNIGYQKGQEFDSVSNYDDSNKEDIVYDEIHYAVRHARKYSDYHPEEALCIIDAWNNGDSYYGNTKITNAEYEEAVESLYYFYMYFYGDYYKTN